MNCVWVVTIEPIWLGVSSSSAAGAWVTTATLVSLEWTLVRSEISCMLMPLARALLKNMMRMSVGLMPALRSWAMRAFTAG